MKITRLLVMMLVLALAAACGKKEDTATTPSEPAAGPAPTTPFDPATGTATVSGKVAFEGTTPAAAPLKMGADPNCVALHKSPVYSQEVLVEGGNLQNVFVYVKEGLEKYSFTAPGEHAIINQEGCRYTPHVSGMMVGQTLKVVNRDPTLHNIHCWAEKNPQFNMSQPFKDQENEKTFSVAEVMIPFRCDVHKWMSSYVGVLPHSYFGVTGKDGGFSLKNLPPGDYVIEAWHEKYGTKTQKVTVADKEAKEISFTFTATS